MDIVIELPLSCVVTNVEKKNWAAVYEFVATCTRGGACTAALVLSHAIFGHTGVMA